MKFRSPLLAVCALVALGACDDDLSDPIPLDASIDSGTPSLDAALSDAALGDATLPSDPSVQPLYVGSSRVFDPSGSGSNGYLYAFRSIAKGTSVSLTQATEIEDAWVFGDAKPYFYTAGVFVPTIQRWTVATDGKLAPGPVLNLTNQGVMGAHSAAGVPLFSATKAYFVDTASAQVVIWNPRDMTFLKTIPITLEDQGALMGRMDANVAFRDGKAFVTAYWASQASMWTQYGAAARLFVIDTATDTLLSQAEVSSTSSLGYAGTDKDGTIWYSPWDYHAAVRGVFGTGYGAASRGVRVKNGATAVDGTDVDLSALVGGRPAGGMILIDDSTALLHVWHNDLVNASASNWSDTRFQPGYLWHRWKIGEASAPELPNQKPNTEGGEWKPLDGKTVSYSPDDAYANTTLWQLEADGSQTELLTVPGWTINFVRAY